MIIYTKDLQLKKEFSAFLLFCIYSTPDVFTAYFPEYFIFSLLNLLKPIKYVGIISLKKNCSEKDQKINAAIYSLAGMVHSAIS
jgi:hypothetical protein